ADVIPIIFVQPSARIGAAWSNQLDAHQEIRIHWVVRTQPLIEASAGNSEHRNASAHGRWSQPAMLVGCSVKLIADTEVEREGWMHLPIVFEEHGPIVLMCPGELP